MFVICVFVIFFFFFNVISNHDKSRKLRNYLMLIFCFFFASFCLERRFQDLNAISRIGKLLMIRSHWYERGLDHLAGKVASVETVHGRYSHCYCGTLKADLAVWCRLVNTYMHDATVFGALFDHVLFYFINPIWF